MFRRGLFLALSLAATAHAVPPAWDLALTRTWGGRDAAASFVAADGSTYTALRVNGETRVVAFDSGGSMTSDPSLYLGGFPVSITAIAVDGAGAVFVAGRAETTGFVYVGKFNSTGGPPVWSASYDPSGGGNKRSLPWAIAVNPSGGQVYVAGAFDSGAADEDAFLIQFNSAGAEQWVKVLD